MTPCQRRSEQTVEKRSMDLLVTCIRAIHCTQICVPQHMHRRVLYSHHSWTRQSLCMPRHRRTRVSFCVNAPAWRGSRPCRRPGTRRGPCPTRWPSSPRSAPPALARVCSAAHMSKQCSREDASHAVGNEEFMLSRFKAAENVFDAITDPGSMPDCARS